MHLSVRCWTCHMLRRCTLGPLPVLRRTAHHHCLLQRQQFWPCSGFHHRMVHCILTIQPTLPMHNQRLGNQYIYLSSIAIAITQACFLAVWLKTEPFKNSEFPKTQTNFTKTQQKFYQNSDFRKLIKSLFKLRYCIIYVNCIFWCNILSVPKT